MPNNPLVQTNRPILTTLALPLLFLGFAGLFFVKDLLAIHDLWLNNHSYDLGYPTLALSLFFSYQSYAKKPAYQFTPPLALLAFGLLIAIVLYILADAAIMQAPRLLGFILIGILFIAINTAPQQRFNQLLAFGLLLYTIPVWGIFTSLLQFLTVKATSLGLELTQIPATIHGYYISLPAGMLHVEEGCAGLRYLITTLLICHVFCLMNKPDLKGWIYLFTAGTVLALIANWIRVFILSYVAYITELQHPWIKDHNSLGWAVYSLIYIPLYFLAGPIINGSKKADSFSFLNSSTYISKKPTLLTLVVTITALTLPHGLFLYKTEKSVTQISYSHPENMGLCYINKGQAATLTPNYPGSSQLFSATYDCTEGRLETFYLIYSSQTQGKELINEYNTLLDEKIWRNVKSIDSDMPQDFLLTIFVNSDGQYVLTAHTYIIEGIVTASEKKIRSIMMNKALLENIPAGLLTTAMLCKTNCSDEDAFMKDIFTNYIEQIINKSSRQ
jgi:exosortase